MESLKAAGVPSFEDLPGGAPPASLKGMGARTLRILIAALLACLAPAVPPAVHPIQRIDQLREEPVNSIRLAFQEHDARLYWTQVYEKLPVDEELSIMVVEAAPLSDSRRTGYLNPDRAQSRFGVFAVSGPGNRVECTLDIFPPPFDYPTLVLEPPTRERVYIHWLGNYGAYTATTRYDYHPSARTRARRTGYGRFSLHFVTSDGPRLYYRASFTNYHPARLASQNAGLIFDTDTREFTITATPPARPEPPWRLPRFMRWSLPDGMSLDQAVEAARHHRRDLSTLVSAKALHVYRPGTRPSRYTHPPTTRERLAAARPDLAQRSSGGPAVFEPNANFGPVAARGETLWFASDFYDGEGQSGVGAIGRITLGQRTVDISYPPEMACCAASALYVEPEGEEFLYAGLMNRPEGAPIGRGLLRYHPPTGETRHYAIPDVIHDIRRAGAALVVATAHGLYLVEEDTVAHYRLEPAPQGGLELVTFALPRH